MPFGNVNVDYAPCKSVGALKASADYMLGRKKEQIESGVKKTEDGLFTALGCNRKNFANNILVTRKLNGKSYSKHKENTILTHKMSISFHPEDNVSYKTAFEIAQDFAEHFIHSKGFEVLFAVHTDTDHVHVHFLISNCNMDTGKAYRRSQHDLYEMSEYFGQKCLEHGFTHSVRDSFYNNDMSRQKDKLTFGEAQMKKRGAESFKDELRAVIRIELADPNNRTFDDVIRSLEEHYNVECRVAGNTVSYRHPQYLDKNGKQVSVRGSRLGDQYTRKGIEYELTKKYRQYAAAGTFGAVGKRAPDESRGQAGGRGQVPDRAAARNGGQNVRGHDGFYERYADQVTEDERRTAETAGLAGGVPAKRKKRRR